VSPTHQDLSNDTTFSQIKSRVPVPLKSKLLNDVKQHRPSFRETVPLMVYQNAFVHLEILFWDSDISLCHLVNRR